MQNFDNRAAEPEGWAIFSCSGSVGGEMQLCRDDEQALFPGDDQAWQFVVEKANAGSAYHQAALEYIRATNPIEWVTFARTHNQPLVHPNGQPMLDVASRLLDERGNLIMKDEEKGEPYTLVNGSFWGRIET